MPAEGDVLLTTLQKRNAAEAEGLVGTWQERLHLQGWDVRCVFVHATVLGDETYVEIDRQPDNNVVVVTMAVECPRIHLEAALIDQLLRLVEVPTARRGN